MPKEARLIAAVLVVLAVIVGALVIFSGDDGDSEVNASDTTAAANPTTTAQPAPTGADAAAETTQATGGDPTDPPAEATAPTVTTTEAPAAATQPGAGQPSTGGVAVKDLASWQTQLTADTVRTRFDAADSDDDSCVALTALTSLPDLNVLPTLPEDEVQEYFTRWQSLAERTTPDVEGELKARFDRARLAMGSIEKIVNANGGTFNEDAVDELLGEDGGELTQLLAFFTLVADQCPPPAA